MKRFFLIAVLTFLGLTQLAAQETEYVPFVREGVKWICHSVMTNAPCAFEIKGIKTIGETDYQAMHKYSGERINTDNDTVVVYLREEDKVVYGIVPDGKVYPDCPIGRENDSNMSEKILNGEEFVLYDFNDPIGFIEDFVGTEPWRTHKVIPDHTMVDGTMADRYIFRHYGHDLCLVEGIGYDSYKNYAYPLFIGYNDIRVQLDSVICNGEVIYSSERNKLIPNDEICMLPIVRKGVQWVNERVIINNGDTTKTYYTYEFNGENRQHHAFCHYSQYGTETDEIAAVFRSTYNDNGDQLITYDNVPYAKVVEEGRDMIFCESFTGWYMLYKWDLISRSDISYDNPINYYIYNQMEDFLNRENFVEIEPLMIQDTICRRFVYMDELGAPLAYLVEGIGFDSREMGDLLTPFTRKPDPDAEYQEWCGLSHVIKDGKIIYKGMRYDADRVEAMYNDINGDGKVDVADVTALIRKVLNSESITFGSNKIPNVADVVKLIDYVLNH